MIYITRLLTHLVILILAFFTLVPFLWVAMMATHERSEIFSSPPPFYFGDNLLDNYSKLLEIMPFWMVLGNSLFISIMATIAAVLTCSLCAFGFAAFQFRGKNTVFAILIASMMAPPVLTIIPYFLTAKFLGILDTHFALWFPMAANAFGIFLVRQYIVTSINKDMIDAAYIDGASSFRIYWSIVLPLIRPVLATLAIVVFIGMWNNFLQPLVILSSPDKFVLTLALRSVQSVANTPWGAVMLGTFLSMLPLLVAFLFFSRQMIAGLTSGAVKG